MNSCLPFFPVLETFLLPIIPSSLTHALVFFLFNPSSSIWPLPHSTSDILIDKDVVLLRIFRVYLYWARDLLLPFASPRSRINTPTICRSTDSGAKFSCKYRFEGNFTFLWLCWLGKVYFAVVKTFHSGILGPLQQKESNEHLRSHPPLHVSKPHDLLTINDLEH